jgi:hypothetical protein
MPAQTNKELLKQIAEQQFSTSTQLSIFMNSTKDYISKQNSFNERIAGYLENDDKTNQIGVVQKQADIEVRVRKLELNRNVAIGVTTIALGFVAWLGNVFK